MSDELLKCRRCRKVSEQKDLKRVPENMWTVLVCPNCNCKSFSNAKVPQPPEE